MTAVLPVVGRRRLDLEAPDVSAAVAAAAILADQSGAAILRMLAEGPRTACARWRRRWARANNAVSNHLARLREAGLVRASRHEVDARWLYYERDEEAVAAARAQRSPEHLQMTAAATSGADTSRSG